MPTPKKKFKYFESDDHALVSGMMVGLAAIHGLILQPVIDEEGNYTNRYEIVHEKLPHGLRVFLSVEPPVKKEES